MGFDTLPPWDANRWFDLPTAVDVPLGAAVATRIVEANPMRVGLILMDHNGGNTKWIYKTDSSVSATTGHAYPVGQEPVQIMHNTWGPLCQSEWWGFAPAGNVTVTVLELTLRDWPVPDPYATRDVQDYLAEIYDFIRGLKQSIKQYAG